MEAELKIRRARRDDFARIRALLGADDSAPRAERKRFRHLTSTLREDCYVAEHDGDAPLAGLAVIVYVRGLGPSTAIVRCLRGTSDAAALLLECARSRAAARGCVRLELHLDDEDVPAEGAVAAWLAHAECQAGPRTFRRRVDA